jgi:hypothetical protein
MEHVGEAEKIRASVTACGIVAPGFGATYFTGLTNSTTIKGGQY